MCPCKKIGTSTLLCCVTVCARDQGENLEYNKRASLVNQVLARALTSASNSTGLGVPFPHNANIQSCSFWTQEHIGYHQFEKTFVILDYRPLPGQSHQVAWPLILQVSNYFTFSDPGGQGCLVLRFCFFCPFCQCPSALLQHLTSWFLTHVPCFQTTNLNR